MRERKKESEKETYRHIFYSANECFGEGSGVSNFSRHAEIGNFDCPI